VSDGDPPKAPPQGTLLGFGTPQEPAREGADPVPFGAPASGPLEPSQVATAAEGSPSHDGVSVPDRPSHHGVSAPGSTPASGGTLQSDPGGSVAASGISYGGSASGSTPSQYGSAASAGIPSPEGAHAPGGTPSQDGSGGTSSPRGIAPLPEARLQDRSWAVSEIIQEVPGSKFISFLRISARRAFRLRIEPTEVLPAEREALERAWPPIVDPNLQAFLAWRRSVLFLVACALVPLTVIGFLDGVLVGQATPIRVVKLAPVIAEGVFLAICWSQLRQWAYWRRQRRMLLLGWFLFMATPFIVFLYPLRTVFEGQINAEDVKALNLGAVSRSLLPFKITMIAMLQLAPKAISLMPGLVRASLVIKLLFPGSVAPGWLIVVAAPIYALLAYVILIVPYQFTGSGWFIGGVLGIIAGQILLARSGFKLAQPLTEAEALYQIKRVRKFYLITMVSSAVLIVVALGSLASQLNLHPLDVILSVLKFETNVLILTLIGADLVITNLDRARTQTLGRDHHEDQAEAKIAAFVSLDAPHVPPPPGPAPTHRP